MKEHLARYKRDTLRITEDGPWRRKPYPHILPLASRESNILPSIRADFWSSFPTRKITLHKDFHHLNSSQAFAFNLFFPLMQLKGAGSEAALAALGLTCPAIGGWCLEAILDAKEGTNFDACACAPDGTPVCRPGVEVKLTESAFGAARNDDTHRNKRDETYRKRLCCKVRDAALEDAVFFPNYQILRNVSYADPETGRCVVFLLPEANRPLVDQLTRFLRTFLLPAAADFVHVVYAEDFVARLRAASALPDAARAHYHQVAVKYGME